MNRSCSQRCDIRTTCCFKTQNCGVCSSCNTNTTLSRQSQPRSTICRSRSSTTSSVYPRATSKPFRKQNLQWAFITTSCQIRTQNKWFVVSSSLEDVHLTVHVSKKSDAWRVCTRRIHDECFYNCSRCITNSTHITKCCLENDWRRCVCIVWQRNTSYTGISAQINVTLCSRTCSCSVGNEHRFTLQSSTSSYWSHNVAQNDVAIKRKSTAIHVCSVILQRDRNILTINTLCTRYSNTTRHLNAT